MKEDKFCLSKSVAFIAVVAFILVGVVVFTNYMNSQKVGGTPKATSETCDGTYNGYCTAKACGDIKTSQGGIIDYLDGPSNLCGTGLNCCVPQPQATLAPPAAGSNTCSGFGGNWYPYADCSAARTNTKSELVTPSGTVTDTYGTNVCCVKGNWPTPAATQTTCVGAGGDWYPKSSYATCADIGGYADVSAPGGSFVEDYQGGWSTSYNCCKPVAIPTLSPVPTLPLGSKSCKEFGGDWYSQTCADLSGSYVAVSPTGVAEISDKSIYSGKNCCKPAVTDQKTVCGYFAGEACFKTSAYSDCSKVDAALGGGWKAAPAARTSCTSGICCTK